MSEDEYSDSYNEPAMDLVIETLTGTSFEMKVYPSDTILDIKNKIQRVEGIPVHHQNLLFRLNELKDHNRLCDVGIQNGSVLKLVLSMRGGPISTRRLSSADQHIWKNLKELLENTREELGDKLGPGSEVSVLVFKDGDIINLIRVVENDAGAFYPMGEPSTTRYKSSVHEDSKVSLGTKLKENDNTSAKLMELRKKMSELTLKRNLRHMGCTSKGCNGTDKPGKSFNEELKNKNPKKKKERRTSTETKKQESFYNISFKLLEDEEKNEGNSEGKNGESKISELGENFQNDEDSIALKEKHRGNKSKQNFLYTNFSEMRQRSGKPFTVSQSTSAGFHSDQQKSEAYTSLFSPENREKPGCSHHIQSDNIKFKQPCYKKVKLSPKTSRKETSNIDEKVTIWSPLSPLINRGSPSSLRRMKPQENSVNIPEVPCQIDLSSSSATSSIAILEEEETESEEKELLSPIGLPCVGTVSMSKVPDIHRVHLTPIVYPDKTKRTKNNSEKLDIEDNCDIYSKETKETCRSSANCKFGLLRRRQSLDCSSRSTKESNDQSKSGLIRHLLLEGVKEDMLSSHFAPMGPSAIPSEYTPRDIPLREYYVGNYVLRSPLYRRQSQMSSEVNTEKRTSSTVTSNSSKETKPRNLRQFSWNSHLGCSDPDLDLELPLEFHNKSKDGQNFSNEGLVKESDGKTGAKDGNVKVLELPTVVAKKKIRCGLCNKRLNITNMYDCRCGGIFCSQHRYSEVHGCKFDYKAEGLKVLEKQNPLVVAEKLQKF